jgi:hypothetical protein
VAAAAVAADVPAAAGASAAEPGTAAGRRADVIAPTPTPAATAVAAGLIVVADIAHPDVPAVAIAGSDRAGRE